MKILVTGSAGFIGKHLVEALHRRSDIEVIEYDLCSPTDALELGLREADVIYHLAGVNRPQTLEEFKMGNADFTDWLCASLSALKRKPILVLSSSIQAAFNNPYGQSKKKAEIAVASWAEREQTRAIIFRLKNVFGKWCRPNYNSVIATFCNNIAHVLPIIISDDNREIEFVYIDDVVAALISCLDFESPKRCEYRDIQKYYRVTLGVLASKIRSFRDSRKSLMLPSFEDEFTRRLYATYLSYLPGSEFSYALEQRTDMRGSLAEFMKSAQFGQIFVSRTKPGITRGNHYHHTKTEKFLVVEGEAMIRFRHVNGGDVIEYRVNGREFRVVDIPPGYAHSIENIGACELVTLFWASENFDLRNPDVHSMTVLE